MSRAGNGAANERVAPDTFPHPAPPRFAPADGYDYDRDDPTFLADLRASQQSVDLVARWFRHRGYPVHVYPLRERPSPREMRAYRDNGDLAVGHRVEVKQRRFTFTSAADYPFPTVHVVQCNKFDGVHPTPWLFVIVSHDFRAGLLVDVRATRAQWTREPVYLRTAKREREMYLCPLGLVTAVRFDDPGAP